MGPLRSGWPFRRLATLAFVLAAACGDSSGAAKSSGSPAASDGGLLFVLNAPSARLERDASGAGRLVLEDPSSGVTSFTDRPERSANTLALADFVAGWSRYGFAAVPPNAALVVEGAPEAADVAVFEIASPRLADGTLTLDVAPLSGTATAGVRTLADRADASLPVDLGRVSLFVDDAASPVTYQQVVLQFTGGQPGQQIVVRIAEADGPLAWSFGPSDDQAFGFSLMCEEGTALPLAQLGMGQQVLEIQTSASDGGGSSVLSFTVVAYLAATGPVSEFSLASPSVPGFVTASVGGEEQVPLGEAPTTFAWAQ